MNTDTMPSDVVTIEGMDWDGSSVERFARPGMAVCLRGEFGKGFDTRGPQAWVCPECADVRYMRSGDLVLITAQRHLWDAHSVSAAMLP